MIAGCLLLLCWLAWFVWHRGEGEDRLGATIGASVVLCVFGGTALIVGALAS